MARHPRRLHCVLLAAAVFVVPQVALAQAAASSATVSPSRDVARARVDSLARAFVAANGSPGVSIQVVWRGDTLLAAGYGLADVAKHQPATAATVYRIGSVTKQFTSAAVMRLVERRKVALDDSIAAYVPGLPATWRAVTVRQLLNHTSGIPSYTDIGEPWRRRWGEAMSPATLVSLTANDTMWFKPGAKWHYDNTGYVLLGMLLDRVTREPYPRYIENRLARPLGLAHVYYCDNDRNIPNRARGYDRQGETWREAAFIHMSQPYSAGALCATVGDLARWDALLSSGRVVNAESWKAMTTPVGAAQQGNYGFGLTVGRFEGHPLVSHGGGIHGFISANAIFPADSLTITVLTNSGAGRADPLLNNIARAVLGLPLPQGLARVTLSPAERARYAGRYELHLPNGAMLAMRVWSGDSAVLTQATGQPAVELIAFGNHVFGAAFDPSLRMTFHVEGDHATSLTLLQGGATIEAPRVGEDTTTTQPAQPRNP